MSSRNKPNTGYFSLNDILATNERLPCRIELPVHKLGFLDPSSESPDLLPGTKLDLPFWLAQSLHRRQIISVDIPKVYREGYREILNADANVVDLNKLGPYFYHFGLYLLKFPHPEATDIVKALVKTFKQRFRRIMDCAQNSLNEDPSEMTSHLDRTELTLFRFGQKTLFDFQHWQARKLEKIATSDMVVNHKKRKRAAMETALPS